VSERDFDPVEAAQGALGHRFAKPKLLMRALVHRSAAAADTLSYERLEFLGDRVLGLVIAEMLYERFPGEAEGPLARRHAALVRKEALARVADEVSLGRYIILSKGEEDAGGRENTAILADVCEAVLGALYLDGGLAPAKAFIGQHWPAMMEEAAAPPKDAKTALQEWAQQRGKPLPVYETLECTGPDHSPQFTVEVSVKGLAPLTATGPSKRAAAQAAARSLLDLALASKGSVRKG
jgi:ribonuclease-3